ncbi:asparagine synthase-related protein [Bacillus cereus]|nr:asparagine synthase-related protein [Bacillus cereus]
MKNLLVEWTKEELKSYLDISYDETIIVPINSNHYKIVDSEKEFKEKLTSDSQYIKINFNNKKINIKSSWYGEFPLFFYVNKKENLFLMDPNFENILKKLKSMAKKIEIDKVGFYQSAILDNPLRRRTLFKDINKIIAGEEISIELDSGKIKREDVWVLPFNQNGYEKSEEEYLEEAKTILKKLLFPYKRVLNNQDLLIPLSGGLDSRLLACLAQSERLNFRSLVFGPKHSNEVTIAKEVSRKLNIKLEYKELRNSYYLEYGEDVVKYTGGLSSAMHCHLYSILKANNLKPKYLIHGFMGDVYAGDSQPIFANDQSITKSQALQMFMNKVKKHLLWSKMEDREKEEFESDLREIMEDCCEVNLPCHFDEYVHNVDRQFSLISNVFTPIEQDTTIIRPFTSKEYCLFFNTLPYELRKNRYLYIKAAKELFPDAFSIPTQKVPLKYQRISKYYPNIRKLFLGAFVLSYISTKGKLTIGKSMVYENHHELLDHELKEPLNIAIGYANNILRNDFSIYGKLSALRFKETKVPFRLINLYWLNEYIDLNND